MKTTFQLTGIDSKNGKVVLQSNNLKYGFWQKKKDGGVTKAEEGFDKLRPRIGDTLVAEVESEQKSFVGRDGKTINYTDNRILYFYIDPGTVEISQKPSVPQEQEIPTIRIDDDIKESIPTHGVDAFAERLSSLENRVSTLEQSAFGVKIDEVPF